MHAMPTEKEVHMEHDPTNKDKQAMEAATTLGNYAKTNHPGSPSITGLRNTPTS